MSSEKPQVDYSLYLVTGRDLLPPGKVGTLLIRPVESPYRSQSRGSYDDDVDATNANSDCTDYYWIVALISGLFRIVRRGTYIISLCPPHRRIS